MQFRKTAEGLLHGAKVASLIPHAKFTLAYESVHMLCQAVLSYHGYLAGKEKGHRAIVLQTVAGHLQMGPNQFSLLVNGHMLRNERSYRVPLPPISNAYALDFIELADEFHAQAKRIEPGLFVKETGGSAKAGTS